MHAVDGCLAQHIHKMATVHEAGVIVTCTLGAGGHASAPQWNMCPLQLLLTPSPSWLKVLGKGSSF